MHAPGRYNADCRLVHYNRLFGDGCPDPFEVLQHWKEEEEENKARKKRFSITKATKQASHKTFPSGGGGSPRRPTRTATGVEVCMDTQARRARTTRTYDAHARARSPVIARDLP